MDSNGRVKAEIGMRVWGEMGEEGTIIAMTREWCIYKVEGRHEYAEPWDDIVIVPIKPDGVVGSLSVGPKVPVADE